jgi:hypothetical protein
MIPRLYSLRPIVVQLYCLNSAWLTQMLSYMQLVYAVSYLQILAYT